GNLVAEHTFGHAQLHGVLGLDRLASPWPLHASVQAALRGTGADSPLCSGLALVPGPGKETPAPPPAGPPDCALSLDAQVEGTLQELSVALDGEGRGTRLQLHAALAPSAAFPVRQADADLRLADGSGLRARL